MYHCSDFAENTCDILTPYGVLVDQYSLETGETLSGRPLRDYGLYLDGVHWAPQPIPQ